MIKCVFGLPGTGKSTYLAKLVCDATTTKKGRKRYDKVYCNFDVKGTYSLSFSDLGVYNFENSLILIDEAMNEADSRDFKRFNTDLKYFFSNHRHFGCDVVYFTQAYDDVDKKIRNNTEFLLFSRKLLWWTILSKINRQIVINDMTSEIAAGYKFGSILSSKIIFRPKYYKWFDSFERKQLLPLTTIHNTLRPRPIFFKEKFKNHYHKSIKSLTNFKIKRFKKHKKK